MTRLDYIVLLIGMLLGSGITMAAYAIGAEVGEARTLHAEDVRVSLVGIKVQGGRE